MKKLFLSACLAFSALNLTTAQDVVLWGGAGSNDGEFNGGLNNWTTVGVSDPAALWTWAETAQSSGGIAGKIALKSLSAANGAAIFDSDYYDNGGSSANIGKGPLPGPQKSELISPNIDLSGKKDVTLVFTQNFINFSAKSNVSYSKDGGLTWSDPVGIELNDYMKSGQQTGTVTSRVQLPNAGNTDKFKVKFTFDGYYYFWMIDDVAIVEMEANNMRTNLNWFSTAENILTPVTQTRPMHFLNDISNIGAAKQTNVKHSLSIYKTNSAGQNLLPAVYSDTLRYAEVLPDSTVENINFNTPFVHTGAKSTYRGVYAVSSDQTDADPTNNSIGFVFGVTDSTFAKDNGRTRSVAPSFANAPQPTWGYGNIYYIKKGTNFKSSSVQFGIESVASTNAGQEVEVLLFKWNRASADDMSIAGDELETVGNYIYNVKGNEPAVTSGTAGNLKVSLNNWDKPGTPIVLQDDTYYVVYVEHRGTNIDDMIWFSAYDRYDYAAAALAYENAGVYANSCVIRVGDEDIREGSFRSIVPVIRWNIRENTIDTKETLLNENVVSVSPNPAVNYMNVKFDFETVMHNVDVTLFDVNGREVMVANLNNISKDNYNLDVTGLTSGLYNLVVRTETGVTSKNVLIQK